MARRIEDYAIIGDCRTAALVSKQGCIDWLCLPYFDSPACFASLIGKKENGFWSIAPKEKITASHRCYRGNSLVLDTIFETETGKVKLTDFLDISGDNISLVRMVEGLEGEVEMEMQLMPRFEYGALIPLFLERENEILVLKGSDQLCFISNTSSKIQNYSIVSHFKLKAHEDKFFQMNWSSSHSKSPPEVNVKGALEKTVNYWEAWLESCHIDDESPHSEILKRSVIVLKAMTFSPAGSIVAAITTSLPEEVGGERNWDYRFCWPRDAALAMRAVINSTGQREEIKAWRHWIVRATAGLPAQMEVLYTLNGTRCLAEVEVEWLDGFEGSSPVRIGNEAGKQLQLDIYALVIEIFYLTEKLSFPEMKEIWDLARGILEHLEEIWQEPDEGIWEVRGPKRHFVHSKVMVWGAFHYCIKAAEELGIEGPVDHWRKLRNEIHDEICQEGFNQEVGAFTQYYGSTEMDASLLQMPLMEFLPIDDPRIQNTIKKIEEDLLIEEGLIMRYRPNPEVEGLPPAHPRAFLLCSSWLGEVYVLQGRLAEAKALYHKLISLANDVGLLAEQYDPCEKRQVGNFPQAFSHIALIRLENSIASARDSHPEIWPASSPGQNAADNNPRHA